jgi:hypothetical protein
MITFQDSRGVGENDGIRFYKDAFQPACFFILWPEKEKWIAQIIEKPLPVGRTNEKGRCSGGATAHRKTKPVNSPLEI